MAAHNMCNIVQAHLVNQQRPDYLQPVDKEGRFPWKEESSSDAVEVTSVSTQPAPLTRPGTSATQGSKRQRSAEEYEPVEEGRGEGMRKRERASATP